MVTSVSLVPMLSQVTSALQCGQTGPVAALRAGAAAQAAQRPPLEAARDPHWRQGLALGGMGAGILIPPRG